MPTCTYHCRECESHFTSLAAFDAHRKDFECAWPDDARLVELEGGVCKIGNPTLPVADVTLYERRDAADYRKRMNAAHTASRKLSGAA